MDISMSSRYIAEVCCGLILAIISCFALYIVSDSERGTSSEQAERLSNDGRNLLKGYLWIAVIISLYYAFASFSYDNMEYTGIVYSYYLIVCVLAGAVCWIRISNVGRRYIKCLLRVYQVWAVLQVMLLLLLIGDRIF